MPSREGKDTPIQQEKRQIASLTVKLSFVDFDKLEDFNVYDEKDPTKIKYFGKVTPDKTGDRCSCDSFFYGMGFRDMENGTKGESRCVAETGFPFDCKHIINARASRFIELDNRKQGIYTERK